jgi:hypothetical protein
LEEGKLRLVYLEEKPGGGGTTIILRDGNASIHWPSRVLPTNRAWTIEPFGSCTIAPSVSARIVTARRFLPGAPFVLVVRSSRSRLALAVHVGGGSINSALGTLPSFSLFEAAGVFPVALSSSSLGPSAGGGGSTSSARGTFVFLDAIGLRWFSLREFCERDEEGGSISSALGILFVATAGDCSVWTDSIDFVSGAGVVVAAPISVAEFLLSAFVALRSVCSLGEKLSCPVDGAFLTVWFADGTFETMAGGVTSLFGSGCAVAAAVSAAGMLFVCSSCSAGATDGGAVAEFW